MNLRGTAYVLEYSFSQRCFHVETLAEALETNARAFAENRRVDYIPLGIYPTREAAGKECATLNRGRRARRK